MSKKFRNWLGRFVLEMRGYVIEVFEDGKCFVIHNSKEGDGHRRLTVVINRKLLSGSPSDEAARLKEHMKMSEVLSAAEFDSWIRRPKHWNGITYEQAN